MALAEKTSVASSSGQAGLVNKFLPLINEDPKEDAVDGKAKPIFSDGTLVVASSELGVSSKDTPIAVGSLCVPSSTTEKSTQQSPIIPPSSALVLSTGKGLQSKVSFPSPKSSAERKKKKRKYSSPVRQGTSGTSGILPIEWKKDHNPPI